MIEAKPTEATPGAPVPDATGIRDSIKPTHRLVPLAGGGSEPGDIVIELDHELPANVSVKFLFNKSAPSTQ